MPSSNPPIPQPLDALRAVADEVDRRVGPQPLAGLRHWLDGRPAPGSVDFPAAELAEGVGVEALMRTAAAQWGGSPHANAALAWKTYCYWTVAPAVLGYIADRRVPVMDAANTVFTVAEGAPVFSVRQVRPRFLALPHDACAGHPDVEVAANEGELLDRLRAYVFEGHLGPVLDAFLARARVGRRTMLGSLASGLAYAVASIAQAVPEPDEVIAKTLLNLFDVGHLVDFATDEEGRLVYRRRTCCLALTIEGGRTCSTCCVRTDLP
ncbi:IucA/IucC family C-terminal-domain containing protein [Glycomyces sp. NRRL B-16210]|uniref:IucA/IucC family C-terminal-domain containing protein n=1 Tax=Glycomyces sp. NRRL B-16210 TaxID=1463821 RepID=UPI0006912D6A|nr:IucA/IucC family C-terminal-domain containing protein [Glycomyces sp. NRRL B-16210]